MPVQTCQKDGEPGYRWGESGKCYTYTSGDDDGRAEARRKAEAQGAAIRASGWREKAAKLEPEIEREIAQHQRRELARTKEQIAATEAGQFEDGIMALRSITDAEWEEAEEAAQGEEL